MDILGFLKNNAAPSGSVAKDRLRLVIVHDRAGCSHTVLEMLKTDILSAVSGYMEVNEDELDIRFSHTGQSEGEVSVLSAVIPVKNMRTARGA